MASRVQGIARVVQGRKVIRNGAGTSPEPELKTASLPNPALNAPDLSRQTYLSVAEAVIYLRFQSRGAFYDWVYRHKVPKCRGRINLFLRRDLDETVQQRRDRSHGVKGS